LIYNPSNISPPSDGMVDVKQVLDADPSMLTITKVAPEVILEGQGDGGSRKAVVVLQGMHMVPGATVMITKHGGGAANITADPAQVAEDGNAIALTITVPVDTTLPAGMEVELDITVMQPVPGAGMVTQVIGDDEPVALRIKGYDELEGASVVLGTGIHEYSRVALTGGITTNNDTPANPVIVRAIASVSVMGASSVATVGQNGVAAGANGGSGGTGLGGAGTAGMGPAPGQPSGGGGTHGTKGGGNSAEVMSAPSLPTLLGTNRASGGAGGTGGTLNSGGVGGGGGGTIEISAGGTLVVGTISAKGGNGATGAGDAADGGGGSGGTILLRSGVSVVAGTPDVAGGTGANMGGSGRIRIDAPGTLPAQTVPLYYRGTTLVDPPLITSEERPMLMVRGQPLTSFSFYFAKADGTDMRGPTSENFPGSGEKEAPFNDDILFEGLNNVCVQVEGAVLAEDRGEARNCVQIVRLYKKP
jgi:hypothetical protein